MHPTLDFRPGPIAAAIEADRAAAVRATTGLFARDASVWSADASVQHKINDRLGWLSSPALMAKSCDRLLAFADGVRRDGFTDVVLLGMGGSSLAPEVLRAIVGAAAGAPRFHVLDSTDPAAVVAASTDPKHSLYIVASKSGTTIEPNSMAAYFRKRLEDAQVPSWASHFVAITDEGTELAARARADKYRDLFINPSDIGGRYSALSFFGMVPAALMGQNIRAIVASGQAMLAAAQQPSGDVSSNPAAMLGLALGASSKAGRDKLTLIVPPRLEPFGLWIEQLIAESTGKHGKGVVPIAGEPLTAAYGDDRIFVRISAPGASAPDIAAHETAPVASIALDAAEDLGAEFVRWEIATAVAGALLDINPFDEPNVQQAKDATRKILDEFIKTGSLPSVQGTQVGGVTLNLSTAARHALGGSGEKSFLKLLAPGDYLGLLAYVGPDPSLADALRTFRAAVLNRTSAATMFGYGPRYLHSTGQLHKGGPNTGVFVLVSASPDHDIRIPSQPFSFGTLELAQALGDFASLDASRRRALHIHLPSPDASMLTHVFDALLKALP